MHKTILNLRNQLLSMFLLVSIFSIGRTDAQSLNYDLNTCEYAGTVYMIYSDVNPFTIHLDNGLWIAPLPESVPDFFSDGLRVIVGFEYLDGQISPCDSCDFIIPVYLTCARMIVDPPECKARFEAKPLDILQNSTTPVITYPYEFVDVSIGTVKERTWFIDGDSIFGEEVITHIFYEPGYHSVCLAIRTEEDCYDQYCMELYVGGGGDCYADFGYYPIYDVVYPASNENFFIPGYAYQFYDKSHGKVIDWQWKFGDDIITGDSIPIYTFNSPGEYEVCLTIITADSCMSTQCKTVIVGPTIDCQAMFEYYGPLDILPTEPDPDFPGSRVIQFIDMSKGNITKWYWDFGDGTSSYEQNPLHEFPYAGVFEVCLKVASPDGCEARYCQEVYFDPWDECKSYFEYCSYHIPANDSLYNKEALIIGFKNLSYPNAIYSEWDFGDGTNSSEHDPLHVYRRPGVYNVCLSIYTVYGCFDIYCNNVYVGIENCKVDYTHEIIVPDCWGFEIAHYFSARTTEKPWSYYWDFGDGYYATEAEVAHIYENEGFYNVCLEVMYANGCVAKTCKTIYNSIIVNDSIYFEKCNPNAIGITRNEKAMSVTNVYPVPATDILNIDIYCENSSTIDVSLINTLGQKIFLADSYSISAGNNQLELQLENLEPGAYIYVISSSDNIIRGRVSIIQ